MPKITKYETLIIKKGKPLTIIEIVDKKHGITIDKIKETFTTHIQKRKEKGWEGNIGLLVYFPSKDGSGEYPRYLTKLMNIDQAEHDLDVGLSEYFGHDELLFPEKFTRFEIQELQGEPDDYLQFDDEEGGKDAYNDCFYNCLNSVIPDELTKAYPTPESLKDYLKIGRCHYINISHIPQIESQLKNTRINVLNDEHTDTDVYLYRSEKEAVKTVTLRLDDKHYFVDNKKLNNCKGVSEKGEKPIIVYQYLDEKGDPDKTKTEPVFSNRLGKMQVASLPCPDNVEFYDGKTLHKMPKTKFEIVLRHQKYDGKYICVKYERKYKSLDEQWYVHVTEAKLLKAFTNGKYNLFKCSTLNKAIMSRFMEINKTLIPDAITYKEGEWLSDCHLSGLIWCQKGYKGPGYKYDINSYYGYIMQSSHFEFPIRAGTFKTLTSEEFNDLKYLPFGIYRVKIHNYDNQLFAMKKKLVHWDLQQAKKLGYKIELICDGEPNFLDYSGPGKRANGVVFRKIIQELYDVKRVFGKFKVIKKLMNLLWGTLCERNKIKKYVDVNEQYEIPENLKLTHPVRKFGNKYRVPLEDTVNQFNTGFARLGPFLASKCRCIMSNIILPHKDKIVRVYIDGIISKVPLEFNRTSNNRIDDLGQGDGLGDIRLDG
ncbi:MAG TPA: hypothetical protein PLS50_05015, partial [Candidatus Dojkabacteria bacterium]|nr:hypothetical protein [Candidatus Dojkabacteria bacterium]